MKRMLLVLLVICTSCLGFGQVTKEPKEFYSEEFDWRIKIPIGYNALSGEQLTAVQKKGASAIEKATDVQVGNQAKVIFAFSSNPLNYFECNWQPYEGEFSDYPKQCNLVNGLLYQTLKAELKDARMDSTSWQETVSGLVFQVFQARIYLPNDMVMEMLMYSRLFSRKDFTVSILSTDQKTRDELLGAWRSSMFEATKINERRIK